MGHGEVAPARNRVNAARVTFTAALGLVIALVMRRQGGPIFDDPYILLRYAEHLGTGRGWEFNPTTSSENAVTSSLSVLVLAAARSIGIGVERASSVLFFLTTFGAAAFTGLALERSGRRLAGALAALLIASSPVLAAFRGMESSLYLFLVAGALYTAIDRRPPLVTGLLLGLLVLARPDGLVLGAVLMIVFFVLDRDHRLAKRGWATLVSGAAAPIVLFGVYTLATFGNPFPSTLAAKTAQMKSGYWPGYLGGSTDLILSLYAGNQKVAKALLAVLVVGAVVGVVATGLRRTAWQIVMTLLVATTGLVVFYGLVLGIPAYPWYYALPMYTLLVLASLGADFGLSALTQWPTVRVLSAATVAMVFVVAGLRFTADGPAPDRADYVAVGQWLRDNTDPQATVAAMEIGKIGWYSERDMVDYLGLLDSHANEAVARSDFLWWPSYYQPDYWVTKADFVDEPFSASPCLKSSFEPAFRTEIHTVYRRTSEIPDPSEC